MHAFAPTTTFAGRSVRPAARTPLCQPAVRKVVAARRHVVRCVITVDKISNKSYQLEEDEDSLSCTSAVYLADDGTLTIGRTDGPVPDRVEASWKYSAEDGELLLDIERFFDQDATPFSVKRVLKGHLDTRKNLEDLPVFAGAMYQQPADFSPHSEIGWFAMIVATDDLPDANYDISASQ